MGASINDVCIAGGGIQTEVDSGQVVYEHPY